jgi:hypothetical protein
MVEPAATAEITLTRDKREMRVQATLLEQRRQPGDAVGI